MTDPRLFRLVAALLGATIASVTVQAQPADVPIARPLAATECGAMTAEALQFCLRAADNDRASLLALGRLRASASGAARDDGFAVRLFSLAAAAGSPEALNELGRMTAEGRGIARDEAKAARLFRAAADAGVADAAFNLSRAYALGSGVPQNDGESITWLTRAAQANHPAAAWTGSRRPRLPESSSRPRSYCASRTPWSAAWR